MNLPEHKMTSGFINIDKPIGWTSHDVVAKIRGMLRQYGIQRVGHTGTLDPIATGVLPICFGAATKFSAYVMEGDKEYDVICRLGQETDTGDATGKILHTCDPPIFSALEISGVLTSFVGTIMQTPPLYSAIKVNGVPMYRLARKGVEVERAPRPVTIKALRLKRVDGVHLDLNVVCSKGTYIRSLCADLGRKLGVFGTVAVIRRLRTGPFSIDQSIPLDRFIAEGVFMGSDSVIPLEKAPFLQEALLHKNSRLHAGRRIESLRD